MAKGRILIVEDEQDILSALQIFFEEQDYRVLATRHGKKALVACRTRLPHLVLLDIKLPDIDGHQVFRQLRDNPRTCHVPIIFLTQKDERSDKIAGLELGADDYITKPFDMEEVMWRVEKSVSSMVRSTLTHPVTNLPAGAAIDDHINTVKKAGSRGALLYFNLTRIADPAQLEEILVAFADILGETVEKYGAPEDFIGQPSDQKFVVSATPDAAPEIGKIASRRFIETMGGAAKLTFTQVQL